MVSNPYLVPVISFLSLLSDALVKATCPSIMVTAVLPSLILSLALTCALNPMAVAFVRLSKLTLALLPIAVFWTPVVFEFKAT